jgi:hypothetical protein
VRRPIDARALGRWKAYAAELAPLIAELRESGSLRGDNDQNEQASAKDTAAL